MHICTSSPPLHLVGCTPSYPLPKTIWKCQALRAQYLSIRLSACDSVQHKNAKIQKHKNTPPHQEQQQQVSGSMVSILFHVLPLMCISYNNQPLLYVQWCPCFVHFKLFPIPFKGQCMVTNDHEHFLSHGDHVLMYIPQYLLPDPAHCSMGNKINWT